MGGIIVRAALPFLSQYKTRFQTFMTLSSPHLGKKITPGYMYNSSKLVDAGIWVL